MPHVLTLRIHILFTHQFNELMSQRGGNRDENEIVQPDAAQRQRAADCGAVHHEFHAAKRVEHCRISLELFVDGAGGAVAFVGQGDLKGTRGKMATARVAFETEDLIGALLEFRVYVNEGVELNAFHIRTWNMDANTPPWSAVHLEPAEKRRSFF